MGDNTNTVFCQQRRLRMRFNVPITRYTPISPYVNTNLTAFDLDMRRKAEILKHTGSQKSTQSNKMTKAQIYAQVVRGFSPTQKLLNKSTGVYNPTSLEFCDSSLNLVLTSSSDVPGPIRALYLDKDIPLYNFAPPIDAYNENPMDDRPGFVYYPNSDVFLSQPQRLGALEIFHAIPNTVSIFTLTIPYTLTNIGTRIPIDNQLALTVTYGSSPVSSSASYNIIIADNFITINNVELYTSPGFIFEFALTIPHEIITVNIDGITIVD
jgi:hypothetical protein